MAAKKKTTAKAAKKPAAKPAAKKAKPAAKKVEAKKAPKATDVSLQDLDRKGLAARARQIKTELLAIRFNLQAPSLKDYRKKKKELVSVLAQLAN